MPGGFPRGSGDLMDQLVGSRVGLARAVCTRRPMALPPPLGRGVYIGGSSEATSATLRLDLDTSGKIRPSVRLFAGADTFPDPPIWPQIRLSGLGQSFDGSGPRALYFLPDNP